QTVPDWHRVRDGQRQSCRRSSRAHRHPGWSSAASRTCPYVKVVATSVPTLSAKAPIAFAIGWTLRLPYPLRNAVSRWRTLLSMIVGVGIALSIGMTILAVISAEMDLLTGDYERSGVSVYVSTQGGKIVARLAGDTPGTIQ